MQASEVQPPVAVVTGATSGIGRAVAHGLATAGIHVVVVSREAARCRATVEEVIAHGGRAEALPADLTSRAGVDDVVTTVRARHAAVALLVNNAGAIYADRRETVDGHERTFALNVLAPFRLSLGLLPSLRAAGGGARIVNVASEAHRGHSVRLDDLEGRRRFGGYRAYGRSKVGLILVTAEMARRNDPRSVAFFAVHPGLVRTRWGHEGSTAMRVTVRLASVLATSPERAARTVLFAARSPELAGRTGLYIVREHVATPSARARDTATARALYEALVAMELPVGA